MIKKILIFVFSLITFTINLHSKDYLYEDLQMDIKNLKPDESKVANIKDLFWQKEGGMFSLDSGKMYFMQPINNRISVAIFIGKGSFAFTPPTKVEQVQLERLMKTKFFNTEIEAMVLFFTDSTYEFIKDNYGIQSGSIPNKIYDIYKEAGKYLLNKNNLILDFPLKRNMLNSYRTDFYMAFTWKHFGRFEDCPYIYSVDPVHDNEVRFMKGDWKAANSSRFITSICKFNKCTPEQYPSTTTNCNDPILIEKYTIKLIDTNTVENESNIYTSNAPTLEGVLWDLLVNRYNYIKAAGAKTNKSDNIYETKIKCKIEKKILEWIYFKMNGSFVLDSILDENNNQLFFWYDSHNGYIFIKFSNPVFANDFHEITFFYRTSGYFKGQTVPYFKNQNKAYFDISYYLNKPLKIQSIYPDFEIENSEIFQIYKFRSKSKIYQPHFLKGEFQQEIIQGCSNHPNFIFYYQSKIKPDNIINLCSDILNFLFTLFGKYTDDDIIIEIASQNNNIKIYTDLSNPLSIRLDNNMNIANKISQLWWGNKVKNKSIQDDWLSGSFQVYSGYLLSMAGMNNYEDVYTHLNKSKKSILGINKNSIYDNLVPVILDIGRTNNSCAQYGDYNNLIFLKGAWVLHMLRNLFIDFDTMDDKVYFQMIKDFFETYKDSHASTQDFIKIVNKYAGTDMTWFFEQWIESNEMPTYTFGYKKEKTPDGKFKVTARIKQEGVNEKFMMSVPVKIDYGESARVLRLNVTKPFLEFEFPLFDEEPKKFVLNAYESVLCEVEYDDFEDIEP